MPLGSSQLKRSIVNYADYLAATVFIVGGIFILWASYVLKIGQYGMGFAFVVGSVLYILSGRTPSRNSLESNIPSSVIRKIGYTIFLISLGLAVYFGVRTSGERPLLHFVFVTVAYSTILFDLRAGVRTVRHSAAVMTKLIGMSLVFRWIRFSTLETIPGSDTLFHYNFTILITELSSIPVFSEFGSRYAYTPVWHLNVGLGKLVMDTVHQDLIFLTVIVPFAVVSILGLFAVGKRVTGSVEVGVLAALGASVSDMFILRSVTNITPSSYVILFTILLLFLLTYPQSTRREVLIFISISIAVLTHQLAVFALFVIVFCFVLVNSLHKYTNGESRELDYSINKAHGIAFFGMLFAHWTIINVGEESLFDVAVLRAIDAVTRLGGSSSGSGTYTGAFEAYGALSHILYNFGYALLLLVAVVGILVWVCEMFASPSKSTYLVATGALFLLIYPLTLIGLDHIFIPHRLIIFLEIFLVIFFGSGIVYLYTNHKSKAAPILLSIFIISLIFFMITTPYVNRDAPVYLDDRVERVGLTEPEIKATMWPSENNASKLYIDPMMNPYTVDSQQTLPEYKQTDTKSQHYPGNLSFSDGSHIVIRGEYLNREYIQFGATYGDSVRVIRVKELEQSIESTSEIYNSGESHVRLVRVE